MGVRYLYLARHGMADTFGTVTDAGHRQAGLLGERLAEVPVDMVWHSPLPRAADSAHDLARHLKDVPVSDAAELIDHVPYVPDAAEIPRSWAGFFDGYDDREAALGHRLAQTLVARFARPDEAEPTTRPDLPASTHEVVITHAYPIAWLVRHALGAPPVRWLSLTNSGNTALTVIEYRSGLPPTLVMFNDMSHLPADLRWTGFPKSGGRP